MDLQSIEKFNLINGNNKVKPNYDLSGKETYIELYVSKEKLCIVGSVDPNYICWCSLTNMEDKENNEEIFNHIANDKFIVFSQLYKVIEVNNFFKLQKWCHCMVSRTPVKCFGKHHLDIIMA